MSTALFAALSIVCLVVAPRPLASANWATRSPRAGLLAWYALGAAGLLSLLGTGLSMAFVHHDTSLRTAMRAFLSGVCHHHLLASLGVREAVGLTLATDVALVVLGGLVTTSASTVLRRRRHRMVLNVISTSAPGAEVLEHPAIAAYCLPGRRPRIVVSRGTIDLLDPAELGAVLAHERGHAEGHHGLVLLPFASLLQVLSFLPYAALAPRATALLVELAADDAAARTSDRHTLASALLSMATAGTNRAPRCALGASEAAVGLRVHRLLGRDRPSMPHLASSAACSVMVLLAPLACAVVR